MNPRVSLGRILTPADDEPGAQSVVVVNHAWWLRMLAADPSIVGRSVWLNGKPFVSIGVTERGFSGTARYSTGHVDHARELSRAARGSGSLDRVGLSTSVSLASRLSPGTPIAQAEAELTLNRPICGVGPSLSSSTELRPTGPGSRGDHARAAAEMVTGVRLLPFATRAGKNAGQIALIVVLVLTAIALLALALACANVTNLLLAGAIARRTEIGLRIALGARRTRIVRQLLTESLSLGLIAGALGLLFTVWLLPMLAGVVGVPDTFDVRPDGRAYAFLCFISGILGGLGAGLAPSKGALREARWPTRYGAASSSDSRGIEATARRSRWRTGGLFDGAARPGCAAGSRCRACRAPRHRFRRIWTDDNQPRVRTRHGPMAHAHKCTGIVRSSTCGSFQACNRRHSPRSC